MAGDPDALRLRFEAVGPAGERAFRYSLFAGAPAEVLDEYTRLTGRPFEPPEWALRHWRWRGELAVGEPEPLDGAAVNAQLAEDLRMYERFGIPAGVYLIDRPWSPGEFGFESFRWDERRLPNPDAMLAALARPANGRREAMLIHPRAGAPGNGLTPGIRVVLSVLKPGERTAPIRHNSTQVNFCIRGSGSADVGGTPVRYGRYDVWNTPSFRTYTHHNDGDDLQVRLTYSNAPLLEMLNIHIVEDNPAPAADRPR